MADAKPKRGWVIWVLMLVAAAAAGVFALNRVGTYQDDAFEGIATDLNTPNADPSPTP